MYFLTKRTRLRAAGGFMLQVLPELAKKKSLVTKNAFKRCQPFQRFWSSDDHIEALLNAIYGDEPFKRLSEEELSLSVIAHLNVLKTP